MRQEEEKQEEEHEELGPTRHSSSVLVAEGQEEEQEEGAQLDFDSLRRESRMLRLKTRRMLAQILPSSPANGQHGKKGGACYHEAVKALAPPKLACSSCIIHSRHVLLYDE